MIATLDGKPSRRPVRWLVFMALCLVSLAAAAQGGHGGGGHGGGGHGGYSGGHGIGHGGGHFRGHHGGYHGGGHAFFGLGYWPWYYPPLYSYYPYPYYPYYPQTYAVPTSPPVYVERGDEQQSAYWWYYCANPQGYYPYVKQCPGGWQRVSPEPPS